LLGSIGRLRSMQGELETFTKGSVIVWEGVLPEVASKNCS
jgi:hypothetical protein